MRLIFSSAILINYFYWALILLQISAIVPAIRYKAGAKLSASLHRVFHFYPASAHRRNFVQQKKDLLGFELTSFNINWLMLVREIETAMKNKVNAAL
ncbi:MAG TPA: hypothetical protein VEV62_13600 [Parafilimonas sp.]|nr:hypothetical protein [Parafilimonas sp.]